MATNKKITDFFSPTKKSKQDQDETTEGNQLVCISTTPPTDLEPTPKSAELIHITSPPQAEAPTATIPSIPAVGGKTNQQRIPYTFENLEDGLPSDWRNALSSEFTKPYWKTLKEHLIKERNAKAEIFPPPEDIFNAFWKCSLDDIRVVIIGQDPYHDNNQAMGLSFSIPRALKKLPPSLNNIYKELSTDLKIEKPTHGDLSSWAAQGVFLLNTVLTVRAHKANSHSAFGWLQFTDAVVKVLAEKQKLVWVLWGKPAEKKAKGVNSKTNCIIISPHPSPLSAFGGFFGSQPFSKCNVYLVENKLTPIDWKP